MVCKFLDGLRVFLNRFFFTWKALAYVLESSSLRERGFRPIGL